MELVTGGYCPLPRAPVPLGRVLQASDDRDGAAVVTVLGHALWMRRFEGVSTRIGRDISIGPSGHASLRHGSSTKGWSRCPDCGSHQPDGRASRLLQGPGFGISSTDPLTYAGQTLLIVMACALARYLPTRRAAGIDPVESLRSR